jgi:hypothetical protein
MFGPSSSQKDTDDFFRQSAQSSSSSGGKNRPGVGSKGGCVHEDGGRFATFESTLGDPVREKREGDEMWRRVEEKRDCAVLCCVLCVVSSIFFVCILIFSYN